MHQHVRPTSSPSAPPSCHRSGVRWRLRERLPLSHSPGHTAGAALASVPLWSQPRYAVAIADIKLAEGSHSRAESLVRVKDLTRPGSRVSRRGLQRRQGLPIRAASRAVPSKACRPLCSRIAMQARAHSWCRESRLQRPCQKAAGAAHGSLHHFTGTAHLRVRVMRSSASSVLSLRRA